MKLATAREVSLDQAIAVHKQVPEFDADYVATHYVQKGIADKQPHCAVAYIDDQPAGYMISFDKYNDGSVYCWMAGTIPAFRQNGVLTALMDELETWAKRNSFTSIKIKTHNKWRSMLISLVRMNFMFIEVTEASDVAMNAIYLERSIK